MTMLWSKIANLKKRKYRQKWKTVQALVHGKSLKMS